ncbi:MAG: DUF4176 domain-containing protein [Clostridia bacterium]|nr:DUF4176 domain-containing protein [Clostridia bacterium]
MNNVLPVGTIVKLENSDSPIAIVGYYPIISGEQRDYYGVCVPIGISQKYPMVHFKEEQIESVVFEGYKDEDFEPASAAMKKVQEFLDRKLCS